MRKDSPGLLEPLGPPGSPETALAGFAEPVRRWFRAAVGPPTAAQCLAWPALAAGKSLLLCAPTGSGKTLAAFFPILDQLLAQPPVASVRFLYVAPRNALVDDACRDLRSAIDAISAVPLRVG